jgi:hypothetical protein
MVASMLCAAPTDAAGWVASLQIRKGYVMNFAKRCLLVLIVINIGTSILHYVDNILFFHTYPEPHWINPQIIDAFWFVMTPFAVLGYVLYSKGLRRYSYLCLYLYALMSLLVLGHYRYGSMWEMSIKINLLIFMEAIAAVALIAYSMWLQLRAEESYKA